MWRKPGRTGAILYAVLAAVLGSASAFISRLEIERQRGRREAARQLPSGPIIVISNHTSYADGKRGAVDAASSLDEAELALADGEAVGIFPEGRLTRDPMMWPERAKTGAVRLALRTGAPIVPVAMVGAHRVVGQHRVVPTLVLNVIRRPKVATRIGDPIDDDIEAAVHARAQLAVDLVKGREGGCAASDRQTRRA